MRVDRLGLWYTGTQYKQVDVWLGEDEEVPRHSTKQGHSQKLVCVCQGVGWKMMWADQAKEHGKKIAKV